MSIKINIHVTHRQYTNNQKTIEVDGGTVKEALLNLCGKYPDIKPQLFNEKNQLLRHIEIYINSESAYPDELNKTVAPGDELHITAFLSGG